MFGLRFWAAFQRLCFLFLSFFNWELCFHMRYCLSMGPVHCVQDPVSLWPANFVLKCVCQWVLCTVQGTYKPLFSHKLSLKMGLMVLFTYLKIILLHCFLGSISTFAFSFSFFFNWEQCFHMGYCLSVGPVYCVRDPLFLWPTNFVLKCVYQ